MQTGQQTVPQAALSPVSPKKGRPNPLSDRIFRERPLLGAGVTGTPGSGRLSSGSGRGVVINGKPEEIPVRNTFIDFAPAPSTKSGLVTAPATVVTSTIQGAISAAVLQRSPPPSSNGKIGTPLSGIGVYNYTPLQTPQSPGWQMGELPAYLRTYIPAPQIPPPAPQVAPQHLPQFPPQTQTVVRSAPQYTISSNSPSGVRAAGMIPQSTISEGQDKDDDGDSDDSDLENTNLPLDQLPSLGSAPHHLGTCKRCCFFPKGRCTNGYQCDFCHFDHEKRKRKNKKKKKKAVAEGTGSPIPVASQGTTPAPVTTQVAVTQVASANPPPIQQTVVQTTIVAQPPSQPTSPTAIVAQSGPLLTSVTAEASRPAVYGAPALTVPAPGVPAPPPAPPPVTLEGFAPPPAPAPAPPPAPGPPMQQPQWPPPAGAPMPPPQYLAPGYCPQLPLQPPPPQMPPQQPLMLPQQQLPPLQPPQIQQLPPQQAWPGAYPGGLLPPPQQDPMAFQAPMPGAMPGAGLMPR